MSWDVPRRLQLSQLPLALSKTAGTVKAGWGCAVSLLTFACRVCRRMEMFGTDISHQDAVRDEWYGGRSGQDWAGQAGGRRCRSNVECPAYGAGLGGATLCHPLWRVCVMPTSSMVAAVVRAQRIVRRLQ